MSPLDLGTPRVHGPGPSDALGGPWVSRGPFQTTASAISGTAAAETAGTRVRATSR